MQKLNRRKGVGLIEVICTLSILIVLLSFIFIFKVKIIRLKNYNDKLSKYVPVLESVKNVLIFNYDYETMEKFLKSKFNLDSNHNHDNLVLYINKDNINLENIKTKEFANICDLNPKGELPFICLKFKKEKEGIVKIYMEFYMKLQSCVKSIKTYIYKGDY